MTTSTETKAGQSKARDESVRETLHRAGMAEDLGGYTGEQRDRAASKEAKGLSNQRLRQFILNGKPADEGKAKGSSNGQGGLSARAAMVEVLKRAKTPLTAAEVLERIRKRNLAPGLKGKTPQQTLAAQLATKDDFVKVDRGLYDLASRPAAERRKRLKVRRDAEAAKASEGK